jgi:hypothetical protein
MVLTYTQKHVRSAKSEVEQRDARSDGGKISVLKIVSLQRRAAVARARRSRFVVFIFVIVSYRFVPHTVGDMARRHGDAARGRDQSSPRNHPRARKTDDSKV